MNNTNTNERREEKLFCDQVRIMKDRVPTSREPATMRITAVWRALYER